MCVCVCVPVCVVPSGFPVNVTAEAVGSTKILLKWSAVPPQQKNGVILGYKVCATTVHAWHTYSGVKYTFVHCAETMTGLFNEAVGLRLGNLQSLVASEKQHFLKFKDKLSFEQEKFGKCALRICALVVGLTPQPFLVIPYANLEFCQVAIKHVGEVVDVP